MSRRVLALLVFSLAASAAAQDWVGTDWKSQLQQNDSIPAVPAAREAAGAPAQQQAGFDNYVFALEWLPTFCRGHGGASECNSIGSGDWSANNLSLHGLWPSRNNDSQHNFGYCGVDPAVRDQYESMHGTWCGAPQKPQLSNGTVSTLSNYMPAAKPGAGSCLQYHEWFRHGTCSGMTADDYFTAASGLTAQFASTAPGLYIKSHTGQSFKVDELIAAFKAAFGDQPSATLSCDNGMLREVHLSLKPSLGKDLKQFVLPQSSWGNCPSQISLPAARP